MRERRNANVNTQKVSIAQHTNTRGLKHACAFLCVHVFQSTVCKFFRVHMLQTGDVISPKSVSIANQSNLQISDGIWHDIWHSMWRDKCRGICHALYTHGRQRNQINYMHTLPHMAEGSLGCVQVSPQHFRTGITEPELLLQKCKNLQLKPACNSP